MGENNKSSETLEQSLLAFLDQRHASARGKIEKLYSFLDILDRKASTLCTVNSLLMAVNGLLVFRPPPSIDTAKNIADLHFWAERLLPIGVIAMLLSLATVLYAVFVNSMKWPFLHNYSPTNSPSSANSDPFSTETQLLCDVITARTSHVQTQRHLTLAAIFSTLIAVALICYKTWFG